MKSTIANFSRRDFQIIINIGVVWNFGNFLQALFFDESGRFRWNAKNGVYTKSTRKREHARYYRTSKWNENNAPTIWLFTAPKGAAIYFIDHRPRLLKRKYRLAPFASESMWPSFPWNAIGRPNKAHCPGANAYGNAIKCEPLGACKVLTQGLNSV